MHNSTSENKKGIFLTTVILVAVFISAVIWAFFILNDSSERKTAFVYSGGKLVKSINLENVTEPYSFRVEDDNGGYNIVSVEKGKICVSEASCPDKVCVNTGFISNASLPVSCLPNKLVIKIESGNDEEADIIAY